MPSKKRLALLKLISPAAAEGMFTELQLFPPSVDLYTPFPTTSPAVYCSPVPKYQILELLGSTVREVTARLPGTFCTLVQVELELEMLVFFHRPPLTPPANTVLLLESLGSKNTTLERPPTLFGPRSSQAFVNSPGLRSLALVKANCSRKIVILPSFKRPVVGSMVNSHICS